MLSWYFGFGLDDKYELICCFMCVCKLGCVFLCVCMCLFVFVVVCGGGDRVCGGCGCYCMIYVRIKRAATCRPLDAWAGSDCHTTSVWPFKVASWTPVVTLQIFTAPSVDADAREAFRVGKKQTAVTDPP